MSELTPAQDQVISLLSTGSTLAAAAEAAGVHRNTIGHWRRTVLPFTQALIAAQYDRALHFRDLAEANAELAVSTIHNLLADPKTPPGVRLRAALAVLAQCAAPMPPEPKPVYAVEPMTFTDLQLAVANQEAGDRKSSNLHNIAQHAVQRAEEYAARCAELTAQSAQSAQPAAPPAPAGPGRNAPCPCKSGRKFKQCCLNRPLPAAA